MPRTQVPGTQVTDGTITTADIADFTVRRADLHTTTAGEAVIAKAVAGAGIELTSTGADPGTGDVTIKADVDGTQRVTATLAVKVPGAGVAYLTHDGQIPHSSVPLILPAAYVLKEATVHVNLIEDNDYLVKIYDLSGVSPVLVATLVTLTAGDLEDTATGLSVSLPASEYGLTIERVGAGGSSDFENTVVTILIEKV